MRIYTTGIVIVAFLLLLQACEPSGNSAQSEAEEVHIDAFIDDVPMLPDSFVLTNFDQAADGEPVEVDSVELMIPN